MIEWLKTGAFLLLAAGLGFLAWRGERAPEQLQELGGQGERFFPDFNDSLRATSLEVIEFEEAISAAKPFKVRLKDGRWTIPSHHDYPADAKDRLKKTAAAIIDLKKDVFRSDRAEDHEALGVIDPLDQKASLKGRGTRVTLRDANDQALADIILGKPAGEGMRYARLPGQARTFATHITDEVSAKFSDWIETDLLKLDPNQIADVKIDSYTSEVDPRTLRLNNKDRQQLHASKSEQGQWKLEGVTDKEEFQENKLFDMTQALRELKIAGVRAKPEGLTEDLKQGSIPLTPEVAQALAGKGFYLLQNGDLYSKEGELNVEQKDGVIYTLRFGEILVGEGEEIEAGTPENGKKEPPKDGAPKGKENRYLFVTARFEPSLLPEPKPREANPEAKEEEKKLVQEENDKKKKDWTEKVEGGKKRAKELSERFAKWYYVIPAEAYGKVHLTRADLVKAKTPPPEPPKKDEPPKPGDGK